MPPIKRLPFNDDSSGWEHALPALSASPALRGDTRCRWLVIGARLPRGTINVPLAADLACGIANPLIGDMMSFGEPAKLPPRPLLDIGAAFNLWRWTRAARMER